MRNRVIRQPLLAGGLFLALTCPVSAGLVFTLDPSSGDVLGAPGALVGWGYSLTNTDLSNWFMSTNLNSDSFSNGTPTMLFDFPILAPGATVTETFDPVQSIGLFEFLGDATSPIGSVNSGNFTLSGEWWNGDPLNGGNFVATAPDIALPYSATVTGETSTTTEPSSFLLLLCGLGTMTAIRIARRRRGFQQVPKEPHR